LIVTPNQITAGALVMSYWFPPTQVNPGWWILLFQVVCAAVNLFPVRIYGEIEFWLSAVKVLILLALMIFMTILTAGGIGPYHRTVWKLNAWVRN
jgi:amino acid transporter